MRSTPAAGLAAMASEFETEVGRQMMRFNAPGVAVDLLAGGKRHSAYMGRLAAGGSLAMTKKSRFATVSLVKLLIAIDLLSLAEQGEISIEDTLADHLPELGQGPTAKGKFLKIRHLLSHTGGFRGCTMDHLLPLAHESWQNCVDLLQDTPQMFEPGTVFEDDHLSHVILGELLARLRGKPVVDAVCEDVLAPLGIEYSLRNKDEEQPEIYVARHEWDQEGKNWRSEDDVYPEPDASFGAISHLSMTNANLARLGEALLAGKPETAKAPLSPWVKEKLFSEVVRVPREVSPVGVTRWHLSAFGMGMATFRGGHRGFMTTGRGQNSCLIFDKDRQSVLALAMNTTNILQREALLNSLLAKFASDASIVPEPRTDVRFDEFIQPFTTRDIGGVYAGFMPGPVEIHASPRGFVVRIGEEDRYQCEAGPENQLLIRAKTLVPIGVFQDPATLRPCLTMGMHPFKKVG
jgi:CubicO group peptidase (beta-lactamase class C family)